MKKTVYYGLLFLTVLALLLPSLSVSESGENAAVLFPEKDLVCDSEGKIQFDMTLRNTGVSDLNDLSLILESLLDPGDPDSIIGEIAALSVNGVSEEDPSDYLWIDSFPAGKEITLAVRFSFEGNESDAVWIRGSLCDEEYCEIAVSEKRCTRPGNDIQARGLTVAGVPVLRILLIMIAFNAILWTLVILNDKMRKKTRITD